jgi:hypothetical protein
MTMFRQGDVLIRKIGDTIAPVESEYKRHAKLMERDNGRVVLAYGEVTGHAHAIHDPGVIAYSLGNGNLLLDVPETATLQHEEHDSIQLDAGQYEVIRQREYSELDEPRQVAD